MAEEMKTPVVDDKTPTETPEVAPVKDETTEGETSVPAQEEPAEGETLAPDAENLDDIVMLLNLMDKQVGGAGEITEVPEAMKGSIKYLVGQLEFVRDLFEDPLWKAVLDDLADQKEDGTTPSVEVAIARNIPLDKITQLAESEDYTGAQTELSSGLEAKKKAGEEDAEYEAGFQESQKAGDEYAAEMGYDETEKNALFQVVLDLFKIMGDGKLTVEEFRKVDKMRNYDKDTGDLRSQIPAAEAKEVLPDQASIEASVQAPRPQSKKPSNAPGMGSMSAYENIGTDVTKIGSRKRGMR